MLNSITIAPITSTIRSIPTEVVLTESDGLPDACAANFDSIQTVPKANIGAPPRRWSWSERCVRQRVSQGPCRQQPGSI
jgi:mRNA-degrading endonuclease toxin of MazEF toxin-antitoxin module